MKLLEFTLSSGNKASFYFATNFVVNLDSDNYVRIVDGVHNNGGWKLDKSHTYEEVIKVIKAYY